MNKIKINNMRKIFLIGAILLLTACTNNNPNKITEKSAAGNMGSSFDEIDVVGRMVAIKNGLTPKIKPTGKYTPKVAGSQDQGNAQQPNQVQLEPLAEQFDSVIIKTNFGDIKVNLYPKESPITVNAFLNLAKKGFYDKTKFHRVIKDFMIQAGDPNSKDDDWSDDGQGGPGYQFQDEINSYKLVRGSLAMANSGPNTNGSQFFIVTAESTPHLDGKHTNFGYVTGGMDVVDSIKAVKVNENDHPLEDVIIKSIELTNSNSESGDSSPGIGPELPDDYSSDMATSSPNQDEDSDSSATSTPNQEEDSDPSATSTLESEEQTNEEDQPVATSSQETASEE